MKKLLISATLLIGMMASAMVFSSFTTPKEQDETFTSQVNVQDGWKEVGRYTGYCEENGATKKFIIWEKSGMCGAYYWVILSTNGVQDPDQAVSGNTGQLRQNSEKKWYAAYDSKIYIIKGF